MDKGTMEDTWNSMEGGSRFYGQNGEERDWKNELEGMKKELRKGKLNEKARIEGNLRSDMETQCKGTFPNI